VLDNVGFGIRNGFFKGGSIVHHIGIISITYVITTAEVF